MVKITFGPGGKFRFQRVLSRGRRVRRGCVSFSFVTGRPFLYCSWTDTYICTYIYIYIYICTTKPAPIIGTCFVSKMLYVCIIFSIVV
jgi:hypothetical protein